MKNNKRKAQFGKPAGYFENSRMITRYQKLRLGSVVELRDNAIVGEWTRGQIGGKRGVVVELNNTGYDYDYRGNKYPIGGWDAVVQYSGTERRGGLFGLNRWGVTVISPRQLRAERLQRNAELRSRQLTAFEKATKNFTDAAATIKAAFQLFFDGLKKSDFVLQH